MSERQPRSDRSGRSGGARRSTGGGAGRGGAGHTAGGRNRGGGEASRSRQGAVSAARLVAYDVLRDVQERDAYANLSLAARIREARLDSRDAAYATELAAGTLRGLGRYDRIIELASGREISAVDPRTRNVLRLGAHQLLSTRTAAHAAVNESVELQRLVGNAAAAGFVNGVLRAIGRASAEEWDARIEREARTPDEALATRTAHPVWVLRALREALRAEGREDELETLLAADNQPPRVSLVVLPGAPVTAEDAIDGETLLESGPSPIGLELAGGDPARTIDALGLPAGFARVQDQGSQLAALALTRATPTRVGERWLDLCAGPGGKSAILGAEALRAGAEVRANEVSRHRADLVRQSVVAVREAVEVVSHDGRDTAAYGDAPDAAGADSATGGAALYDRILVDAPCSGLGALRRRPEARWRKQPSDLPELTALQGELLDAAIAHLAPGGVLAYVTCSPHLAETRLALDAALRRHPGVHEVDAKSVVQAVARDPLDLAGEQLSAQLWPHRHGTDAMFIALVERPAP